MLCFDRSRKHKSARFGFRPARVMSDIVKRRSIRVPRAAFRKAVERRAISMHLMRSGIADGESRAGIFAQAMQYVGKA
jgi:hypothetical protein